MALLCRLCHLDLVVTFPDGIIRGWNTISLAFRMNNIAFSVGEVRIGYERMS